MHGEIEVQKAYESILAQHFEEAVEWFQKAIEQDPQNPNYYYKLSITYARNGRLEEALEQALKAQELDPERFEFTIQIRSIRSKQLCREAEALLANKRRSDTLLAVQLLKEAQKLDPLHEKSYLVLAAAYESLEEYKDAIASLRELLIMDPEQPDARIMLTRVTQRMKEYMEENIWQNESSESS